MRLIDAEKLKSHFAWWNDENKDIFNSIIDQQPTVEPVNHGHWIKIGEIDKDGNQYYQCSKCGKGEIHVPIIDVKYCWNCGTQMDGESNE